MTLIELDGIMEALKNLSHRTPPLKWRFSSAEIVSALRERANTTTLKRALAASTMPLVDDHRQAHNQVLESQDLLLHILGYRDSEDRLLIVPTSRRVRAAYMTVIIGRAALASKYAVTSLYKTRFAQAAHSHARLDAAMLSNGFVNALQSGDMSTSELTCAAGAAGFMDLVRCLANVGLPVPGAALEGAAQHNNAGPR
ncbi:hypothetical protein JKP88DRAFT_318035 [Tribonema minus]|uniref:Uncharacterized protein n=1 Tax=Tribonema minus TaxID=303371 RepID=A0A835YWG8_9STRA|nr:hypothetical protein JKP88DRAFT_318035 [Tribonema minus]